MSEHRIEVVVNGHRRQATVEGRRTLADFLRIDLGCTGVHIGCEHGVCGACTVIVDGLAVRACLMLAVQADGGEIKTVEGVAAADGTLHPVQQALRDEHGLQCGFCTPGVVMTLVALTKGPETPSGEVLEAAMSGHICRCTGYQGIRRAIRRLAAGEQA
ncbi:(2Fe-2S)-binding protein [Phenylobacterium sp. LjRoot225]|uniref:(2Fe-2S)-binding protein n=1 Tax=Phenylobacterium sp. LjRoot225 TaxID=3342285 RepID=UPI003ECD80F9